jgi:uncharacterized membrane protein
MTDSAAPKATPKAWFGLFCVLGLIATACWCAQGATGLPTGAMAGFGEVFAIIAVLVLPVVIYLVPTTIAVNRKHNNAAAIAALNIFLGWTFIGWVVALVWAMTDNAGIRELRDQARNGGGTASGAWARGIRARSHRAADSWRFERPKQPSTAAVG